MYNSLFFFGGGCKQRYTSFWQDLDIPFVIKQQKLVQCLLILAVLAYSSARWQPNSINEWLLLTIWWNNLIFLWLPLEKGKRFSKWWGKKMKTSNINATKSKKHEYYDQFEMKHFNEKPFSNKHFVLGCKISLTL